MTDACGTATLPRYTPQTISWATASDWDAAVDEVSVTHEDTEMTAGPGSVQLGYPGKDLGGSALRAMYPLNGSDATEEDISGNGYDGTVNGTVSREQNGPNGTQSYTFSGGGQIDLPDGMPPSGSMSVGIWYNRGNDLAGEWVNLHNGIDFALYMSSSSFDAEVEWNGSSYAFGVFPSSGNWNSVVAVYDGTNLIVDHDDSNVVNTGVNAPNDPGGSNYIGGGGSDHNVALVRVWGRALSAAERSNFHTTPTTGLLETASKTFPQAVAPNLTNVDVTLNGQTVNLDVIGSPDTGSEEVQTVTLSGGQSDYSLSWNNTHTDFRLRPNLSAGFSSTPVFNGGDLEATVPV